jgi:hypothetical protein
MLQYLQNNAGHLEDMFNDELLFERSGVSKGDIKTFSETVEDRFHKSSAAVLHEAIRNENLSDMISIIRQGGTRIDGLPSILSRTNNHIRDQNLYNPKDMYIDEPMLSYKEKIVNGKLGAEVDIKTGATHLKISTDSSVPVFANKTSGWIHDLFNKQTSRQIKPSEALKEIGSAARLGANPTTAKPDERDKLIAERVAHMRQAAEARLTSEDVQKPQQSDSLGLQLREKHNANLMMSKALTGFVKDGFDAADKDGNGLLTRKEIGSAIEESKDPTRRQMLQFSDTNFNELELVSSSDFEVSKMAGVSKRDLLGYKNYAELQFDNNLAWGLKHSLQQANLKDANSVVKQMGDRLDRLKSITGKAQTDLGPNSGVQIKASVIGPLLLERGNIKISVPGSVLELSTEFKPSAYQTEQQSFLGRAFGGIFPTDSRTVSPQTALNAIGEQARSNRLDEQTALDKIISDGEKRHRLRRGAKFFD